MEVGVILLDKNCIHVTMMKKKKKKNKKMKNKKMNKMLSFNKI